MNEPGENLGMDLLDDLVQNTGSLQESWFHSGEVIGVLVIFFDTVDTFSDILAGRGGLGCSRRRHLRFVFLLQFQSRAKDSSL